MTTYISILRGINVGGHKIIKMEALRKTYENLGFQHVRTYVQSGNVIFESNESEIQLLEQRIKQQIEIDFGFDVPVIVLSVSELRQVIDKNPFLKKEKVDPAFLHVTFLSSKPEHFDPMSLEAKKQVDEDIFVTENAFYLYCPNGYGNTKLTNNFFEKKLNVQATTRNWKTTNELLKLALEAN